MTSTQNESPPESALTGDRLTGKVKWFNNKSGFGFITVCEGEHSNQDIFVHYSAIRAETAQYKYLVQGEYVDFTLVKSDKTNHEYNATDVTGIKSGSIMCETRRTVQPKRAPVRTYRTISSADDLASEVVDDPTDDNAGFVKVQKHSSSKRRK